MDARDMTSEQLMELAREKAGEISPAPAQTVEVGGRSYTIDRAKLGSWQAFRMVERIENGTPTEQVRASVDFASFVCGITEDELVQACGGADARTQDVILAAQAIIKAAGAKN